MEQLTDPQAFVASDEAITLALRTGVWPRAALRGQLDTPESRSIMSRTVASTRDPCEAWDRLALGRARQGVQDSPTRLFYLRSDPDGATPRWVRRRMRASAVPIAMCRSPGVPAARSLLHPSSVRDAVEFSLLAALLARAERLAVAAAGALDALGSCTWALSCARDRIANRRAIWMTRGADHPRVSERAAVLLLVMLLEQLGDPRNWCRALGPLPTALAEQHYGNWDNSSVAAVGALAWRAAIARGCRIGPTRRDPGSRFYVNPAAVGQAFTEFASPFELLLELHSLGVEMSGFSLEAVVLELWP